MKKNTRQVRYNQGQTLRNMPQSVGYQRVTQSVGATGHFKARHYLLMAVVCFVLTQVIKFVLYSVVFRGDATPTGLAFTAIVYVQIVLLLAAFAFVILAALKALRQLLRS